MSIVETYQDSTLENSFEDFLKIFLEANKTNLWRPNDLENLLKHGSQVL